MELGNTITTDAKGWRTASFDGIARLEKDDVLDVRILQKLDDEVIRPLFELPKVVLEDDELNEAFGFDGGDDSDLPSNEANDSEE